MKNTVASSLTKGLFVGLVGLVLTAVTSRAAGTVVAWGDNSQGQTNVPATTTNVVAVAAGVYHSLALNSDGTVVAWGLNDFGATDVPPGLTNVAAIAAGWGTSLALRNDGTVLSWGGDGLATGLHSRLSNVVAIAAGWDHALALRNDGTVVAWGRNAAGQINVPPVLGNVVAIASGGNHNLALKADGTVVAFGDNIYGQTDVPANMTGVIAIAAGSYHSLALKADGSVIAWGRNSEFQCNVPASLTSAVSIAAGNHHSLALKSDGSVMAWGANSSGQVTVPPGLIALISIAAGGDHSLALAGDGFPRILMQPVAHTAIVGSTVHFNVIAVGVPPLNYQWHFNGSPTAGATNPVLTLANVQWVNDGVYTVVISNAAGSVTSSNATLYVYGTAVVGWGDNVVPGLLNIPTGLSNVVAIAAGELYRLALTAEGQVVAWGKNTYGQTNVPSGLSNVVALAAGANHSLALTVDSRVIGWGKNDNGQTEIPNGLSNVVAIAAGEQHSLALTAEGRVVGWGNNDSGQINIPSGLSNVVALAAGSRHSLALILDGRMVGWGNNTYGETDIPGGLSNVVAVAAGYRHSLALTAEGRLLSWGDNTFGQTNIPSGLSNVVAATAGAWHNLALTAEGRVFAWGNNFFHQLNVPSGLTNVVAIAAGWYHSLALGAFRLLPEILSQPVSQTAAVGTAVQFRVAATGASPLQYQWWKHGTLLDTESNAVLVLNDVQEVDGGSYYAVIGNGFGSITSQVAVLMVLPAAPTITAQPVSQIIYPGADVTISVTVKGSRPLSFQWQKDAVALAGQNEPGLTLIQFNASDVGNYRVVVTNAYGLVTSADAILTVVTQVFSQTLIVTTTDDSGAGSLRQAILDAHTNSGCGILFSNVTGTIILTGGELVLRTNLTIIGPAPNILAISGNNASRVFNVQSNATAAAVAIAGLTIRDGAGHLGGGLYNQGMLVVSNCVISNNLATKHQFTGSNGLGGGIYNDGVLSLQFCKVEGNMCSGGGNLTGSGNPSGAKGGSGGGIYNSKILTISYCDIANNHCGEGGIGADSPPGDAGSGGGVYNTATLIINDTTITGNSCGEGGDGSRFGFVGRSGGGGGGIWSGGMLMMAGCTISSNLCGDGGDGGFHGATYPGGIGGAGGAICNLGVGAATNCTISGNRGGGGGKGGNPRDSTVSPAHGGSGGSAGGIWSQGSLNLCNSTINLNSSGGGGAGGFGYPGSPPNFPPTPSGIMGADGSGGGIAVGDGTAQLVNTLIASNRASGGGPDVAGNIVSLGFNLVSDVTGSSGYGSPGDLIGVAPQLGPLADNGSPTLTCALLPGSPAIDAGTNVAGIGFDQRGFARPYDVQGILNTADGTDIGAFEYRGPSWWHYALSLSNAAFGSAGGTNSTTITVNDSRSEWTVVNTNEWLTNISPTNGVGNGAVSFMVVPNCSASRTGIVTIAGQLFLVTQAGDVEPPVTTCPTNIVADTDLGQCSRINLTYTAAASDNCDTIIVTTCIPPAGATFLKGVTTVSCTATDSANNSATCAFTVTVLDTEPPQLTCPPDQIVECGTIWAFGTPVASDNCGETNVSVRIESTITNQLCGGTFSATRTWQATDASANQNVCSQKVTVVDTTQPVLTCPASITVRCEPDTTSTVVTFTVTAADACSPVTNHCVPTSGSTFRVGTNLVTCTATEECGNSSTCSFLVNVLAVPPSITVTHTSTVYFSPGTNTVTCQVTRPAGRQLYSLLWKPELPEGWTLLAASGDGSPEVFGNDILFLGSPTANPLTFKYSVTIPSGQSGTQSIRASAEYLLNGMADPETTPALPNPLTMERIVYHAADYRDPHWAMDATELNRVLAYWRARAYHVTNSLDGFAAGPGGTYGVRHTADYRPTFWQIDGTEMNRVLAYWRAGAYHADPMGADGYAAGVGGGGGASALVLAEGASPNGPLLRQDCAKTYTPGSPLFVTNRVAYSGTLLSLLWRPILPAGWTLDSVMGLGSPEAIAGEIVWTGSLPPSPIQMIYTVLPPAGAHAPRELRGGVEYQLAGMLNPVTDYAVPDPVLVVPTVMFLPATVAEGQIQFTLLGESGKDYLIKFSTNLVDWQDLATLTATNGLAPFSAPAIGRSGFFRGVLKP